jgi:hypothetical protein
VWVCVMCYMLHVCVYVYVYTYVCTGYWFVYKCIG